MTCPMCKGKRYTTIPSYGDLPGRKQPCPYCKGIGHVPSHYKESERQVEGEFQINRQSPKA